MAARARDPDEAWTGRDLRRWAAERSERFRNGDAQGIPAAADLHARLERAVYGGGAAVPVAEIAATAERLGRAGL